jgi:hypothetical protein
VASPARRRSNARLARPFDDEISRPHHHDATCVLGVTERDDEPLRQLPDRLVLDERHPDRLGAVAGSALAEELVLLAVALADLRKPHEPFVDFAEQPLVDHLPGLGAHEGCSRYAPRRLCNPIPRFRRPRQWLSEGGEREAQASPKGVTPMKALATGHRFRRLPIRLDRIVEARR